MRRFSHFASLAGAILMSPGFAVASAQEASVPSTTTWQRIVHPGGAFSIELPCDQSEIEEREEGGSVGIACQTDQVTFGAVITTDGLGAEAGEAVDFDGMLSEAKGDPEVGHVETVELAGGRAFRIWGVVSEPLNLAQITERGPSEVVILAVMMDPSGPNSPGDRAAAEKLAFRYFASLEFSGQ